MHFYTQEFQITVNVIPERIVKKIRRVGRTSLRSLREFILMTPRHLYNPTMLRRRRGFLFNFPVVPLLFLGGYLILQCSQY